MIISRIVFYILSAILLVILILNSKLSLDNINRFKDSKDGRLYKRIISIILIIYSILGFIFGFIYVFGFFGLFSLLIFKEGIIYNIIAYLVTVYSMMFELFENDLLLTLIIVIVLLPFILLSLYKYIKAK